MEKRRFIAVGDIIADFYYSDEKLLAFDGGSSRFNVIANLAYMNCQTAIIGGCGNDDVGKTIIQRMINLGINVSKIFLRDRPVRAYHLIVNKETLPEITYKCTKVSPQNNRSTWYEDSLDDIPYYNNEIKDTDTLIFDTLEPITLILINQALCDKVLDIGDTNRLKELRDDQVLVLKNKIKILQLNERVVPYLMQRFGIEDILGIYNMFSPGLMIVTRGKEGADFVFNGEVYQKSLRSSVTELDPTGAGDAFLSVFVKSYYNNNRELSKSFIDETFKVATDLTSKVVRNAGARGHICEKMIDKVISEVEEKYCER